MASKFLGSLSNLATNELRESLLEAQNGACFICDLPVDLKLHAGAIDVDHIHPLNQGGKDEPSNFALTHASCNRSKQATDLEVARSLARFSQLSARVETATGHKPNLGDLLEENKGARHALTFKIDDSVIRFSESEIGDNRIREHEILTDRLSGERYFFAVLPIEYLHHDEMVNPRNLGNSLAALVKEFHQGNPQLHIALAWLSASASGSEVRIFDGQHKSAAQLVLGVRELPVRVFVNPDYERILSANVRAGTTLRQVAFDKSTQRRLGSSQFGERVAQYQRDHGLTEGADSFSEAQVASYFKGQQTQIKGWAVDTVRNSVTTSPENRLMSFVELAGKSTDNPLSYSTLSKTVLSRFIYAGLLDTPLGYRSDEDLNPRDLEVGQLIRLMNLIAEVILEGQVDAKTGGAKLESRAASGEEIPAGHLRAFRMCREEIFMGWIELVRQAINTQHSLSGTLFSQDKLLQVPLSDLSWLQLRNLLVNLRDLPFWRNPALSGTVFGGKQVSSFWKTIFATGQTPDGVQVIVQPVNIIEFMKSNADGS